MLKGVCVAGDMHGEGGYAWQKWSMHGGGSWLGHAWQDRVPTFSD